MQNFKNDAFRDLFAGITRNMPGITFAGILLTYAITAALNTYYLPLPLYLSIPAAACIQFARFAVVFMDFLNPTGKRSIWPPVIAAAGTLVALVELKFSLQAENYSGAQLYALFLFGSMVISSGYLLEINFIAKGAEAYGLGARPHDEPARENQFTLYEKNGHRAQ